MPKYSLTPMGASFNGGRGDTVMSWEALDSDRRGIVEARPMNPVSSPRENADAIYAKGHADHQGRIDSL